MRKILAAITALILAFSTVNIPIVSAAKDDKKSGVKTSVLTDCGQSDDGITCILNLVVDIMTYGIAILGAIGITVVGVQYLTAAGDEAKARKAKQRMLEIVIGLATYVVIYAILKWLLPTFGGS